jgi:hypothetical protein
MVQEFYQKRLGSHWDTLAPQMVPLINDFYIADKLRSGMYAREPALAVLTPGQLNQTNTLEHNQALQQKITAGFETTRNSINQVEKALTTDKDSSVALKFDLVANQTLASMKDPKQQQQVANWVKQQQKAERDRQRDGTIGLAATTVAGIASLAFGAGELALVFGAVGMVQGGQMSVEGYQQAGVNLDAVQSGDAGGKRLTAMNPYQAQMDYQMAAVNVGLSLLDAGVAVNSVRKVVAARGAVQALGKLEPAQVKQFSEATQLEQAGKTAEAEGAFQTLQKQVGEKKYQDIRKARRILLGLSDPEAGGIRLPGNSKKPATQRIAAMSEEHVLEVGQRLERIDGGHSLDRHGAQVTLEQLDKRLKTGVAPDGVVSFAPASTRFNSNKNWLQTRQQAIDTVRERYRDIVGEDFRKPPGPNGDDTLVVKLNYDRPIDDGFIADRTTKRQVTIPVDPVTGKPTTLTPAIQKTGKVYDKTEPVKDITGVTTRFVWNAAENRWKMVQHFPLTGGWDNATKAYDSNVIFDAVVNLHE